MLSTRTKISKKVLQTIGACCPAAHRRTGVASPHLPSAIENSVPMVGPFGPTQPPITNQAKQPSALWKQWVDGRKAPPSAVGSSALHLHKPKPCIWFSFFFCTASVMMHDAPPHGRAKFTSTPGVTFRLAMSSGTTPKDFTVQLSWDQLCKVSGESQQRMDAKPVNNGLITTISIIYQYKNDAIIYGKSDISYQLWIQVAPVFCCQALTCTCVELRDVFYMFSFGQFDPVSSCHSFRPLMFVFTGEKIQRICKNAWS